MPLFRLICPGCSHIRKLLSSKKFSELTTQERNCPKCDKYVMMRSGQGPTTNVKETLDNGAMPRAVERYANAEELYKERVKNADPEAGKSTIS